MAKYKAFGTQLKRKNGASYDTIPQLISVTPPQESVETIDTTTHDTSGGYRTLVGSFKNGGTVSASFMFDPADTVQLALHTDYSGVTSNTYQIVTVAGSPAYKYQFDALITGWEPGELGIDGKMEVSVTLTVTGAVTISNS